MELKGTFDMSDLPIICTLLIADTVLLLASTDEKYGVEEIETIHDHYGNSKISIFQTK